MSTLLFRCACVRIGPVQVLSSASLFSWTLSSRYTLHTVLASPRKFLNDLDVFLLRLWRNKSDPGDHSLLSLSARGGQHNVILIHALPIFGYYHELFLAISGYPCYSSLSSCFSDFRVVSRTISCSISESSLHFIFVLTVDVLSYRSRRTWALWRPWAGQPPVRRAGRPWVSPSP